MSQTFETGYRSTLAAKLNPADTTIIVATAPTVTSGRMHVYKGNTHAWIKYTGVTGTTLTGVTFVSQTADPASAVAGETFSAGSLIELVAMHDQIPDKQEPTFLKQIATTYATTAARDAALGADGACLYPYTDIYVTATSLYYNYNTVNGQWESVDTGTSPVTSIVGEIRMYSGTSAPAGWFLCDGTAVSRVTYSDLFTVTSTLYGVGDGVNTFNIPNFSGRIPVGIQTATSLGTATMTIATPGVVTKASHGLADGNKVYFTTSGALPTGITASTEYFVINSTPTTFQVSSTLGGAAINTTGSQSGTHTLFSADYNVIGETGGSKIHTLTTAELAAHTHTLPAADGSSGGSGSTYAQAGNAGNGNNFTTSSTGGGSAHNNLQPYLTVNYIIKY